VGKIMSNFVNHPDWHSDSNPSQTVDDHFHAALQHLSDHTKEGGLAKLKKEYPDVYKKCWKQMEECWNHKGIARFQDRMTQGLRKINQWKD